MTDATPSPEALRDAAARLVATLAAHDDDEYRLTVLRRLVRRLGEERYPLFLRLLTVIAESDTTAVVSGLELLQAQVGNANEARQLAEAVIRFEGQLRQFLDRRPT